MTSTRLPGKVLLPLSGIPMLSHVVERSRASKNAHIVIIATSTDPSDDPLEAFAKEHAYALSRGSLDDVLARYQKAASDFGLDTIVRVTSDCPLIDPNIIDESIELFRNSGGAYVSNVLDRVFPRGLDCETFSSAMLDDAHKNGTAPEEREHVTVWMRKHGPTIPHHVSSPYHGNFRLTIDERDDYTLMTKIYDTLYRKGEIIDVRDVITYLREHPEVANINAEVEQKKVSG